MPSKDAYDVERYTKFWLSENHTPKTITILHWLFSLIGKNWIPQDRSLFIKHTNDDCSWIYLRTINKKYISNLGKRKNIILSLDEEIKHRIHASIYHNNLFDHLMPIEVKSFWPMVERKAKILFSVFITIAIYIVFIFGISFLHRVYYPQEAIFLSYNGPYVTDIRDKRTRQRIAAILDEDVIDLSNSLASEESPNFYRAANTCSSHYHGKMTKSTKSLDAIQEIFDKKRDPEKRFYHVCAMLLVSETIKSSDSMNFNDGLSRTPRNNILEIVSQIITIIFVSVLLHVFFSMKNYFLWITRSVSSTERVSVIDIIQTSIQTNFLNRKKFHYCIAIIATFAAMAVHFYFIEVDNISERNRIVEEVGLTPYDYRINKSFLPVYIVNWFMQCTIVFSVVLVCWEAKTLNACIKIVQEEISQLRLRNIDNVNSTYMEIKGSQSNVGALILWSIIIAQAGISFGKIYVEGSLRDPLSVAAVCYIISPCILLGGLAWAATRGCYGSHDEARLGYERKHRDASEKASELTENAKAIGARAEQIEKSGVAKRIVAAVKQAWKTYRDQE